MTPKNFDYQAYLASREWALKREAVRRRSGNRCERCWMRPQQSVHHLTYARVGNEPLEDLQAICDPCHRFLSGKSNTDPVTPRYVYLAGGISFHGWRERIFGACDVDYTRDLPIQYGGTRDGFTYTGPFFLRCDHGCAHGDDAHGVGGTCTGDGLVQLGGAGFGDKVSHSGVGRREVLDICCNQIDRANAIFCWIERADVYGTIAEIGYGYAKSKTIYIAYDSHAPNIETLRRDTWFIAAMSDNHGTFNSVDDAWAAFVTFAKGLLPNPEGGLTRASGPASWSPEKIAVASTNARDYREEMGWEA